MLSPVQKIEVAGEGLLRVQRLTDDGYQVVEVQLPALLAVSSEIGEPRYPPLRSDHGHRPRPDPYLGCRRSAGDDGGRRTADGGRGIGHHWSAS